MIRTIIIDDKVLRRLDTLKQELNIKTDELLTQLIDGYYEKREKSCRPKKQQPKT
jgi:hypothetical protein